MIQSRLENILLDTGNELSDNDIKQIILAFQAEGYEKAELNLEENLDYYLNTIEPSLTND